jgi:hypothetical protein
MGCDPHDLTFLLDNMGFELDRAPVEFSLHLQEPVALFDAPVILVHNHPPKGSITLVL